MSSKCAVLVCAVGVVIAVCGVKIAVAADIFWDNPTGGSFQTGSNWLGGVVPGPSDYVRFDLATAGYTVTFSGNANTEFAEINNDTVTFSLGGNTYSITNDLNMARAGESASLTVTATLHWPPRS